MIWFLTSSFWISLSAYFEGNKSELGTLGYSRDNQPGKEQLTFGIATGINEIPTALTIQKGNLQDKKHFKFILKAVKNILEKNSLLIFDCGANTKLNKNSIKTSLSIHLLFNQVRTIGNKYLINMFF